jgi:trimethylamine--corrinoid protein Co-methyltransferase
MLDGAQMLSLPKILLDCELFRQCLRVREGLTVDDAHLMTDVVAEIGPGGHFLKAKQTRRFMRAGELYVPRLLLREPYDTWSIEKKSELERAVDAVEAILAEHRPKPLPAGAEASIRGTIAAAGRALGGR